jgi:hypothetical protein
MLSQNFCVVAVLALSLTALGQEQKDVRVESKVIGPGGTVQVIAPEGVAVEDIDLDLQDLDLGDAVGSIIFGVEGQTQDADEKDAKPRKRQDAGKEGTVVKEIDLGDGRKMRIVITTEVTGKGKGPGTWMTSPDGKSLRSFAMPHKIEGGDYKVFTSPEGALVGPHGFHMGALGGQVKEQIGEVKEQMERALRAFDKAREEFIRAYKESAPDQGPSAPRRLRIARTPAASGEKQDVTIERKAEAEKEGAALKEKIETSVNQIKAKIEEEVKKAEADATKKKAARTFTVAEPKVVGVAPGASTKKEIDELRKEIKELERMVRDLKKAIEEKDE